MAGDGCYRVNSGQESRFVSLRRFVEAAYFAHVLKGGRTNLVVSCRWLEVEECFDVTAHIDSLSAYNRI